MIRSCGPAAGSGVSSGNGDEYRAFQLRICLFSQSVTTSVTTLLPFPSISSSWLHHSIVWLLPGSWAGLRRLRAVATGRLGTPLNPLSHLHARFFKPRSVTNPARGLVRVFSGPGDWREKGGSAACPCRAAPCGVDPSSQWKGPAFAGPGVLFASPALAGRSLLCDAGVDLGLVGD